MAKKNDKSEANTVRVTNRKARRDYHILETYEAGIELKGTEVKSLRDGKGNMNDSFATVEQGEVWLHNFHISTYEQGNRFNHEPIRDRRLLLHKIEIIKLRSKLNEKGFTLVPLQLYFNKRGLAKVELGVGKGKLLYDKREDIKKRTEERELSREFRNKGLQRFM